MMKYYDMDTLKMSMKDGEWFLGTCSGQPNVWISPFTGKARRSSECSSLLYFSQYGYRHRARARVTIRI